MNSERDIPLCWHGSETYVTVELAEKWYDLYVVHRNEVRRVPFDELEPWAAKENVSAYCDHCPNPTIVEAFAFACGYEVSTLAIELIAGRWIREGNRYPR